MQTKKILTLGLGLLSLTGCLLDDEKSTTPIEPGSGQVYVFTSDYQTGSLHKLNLEDTTLSEGISFHQDSKLANDGENLWVIERLGADNLVKIPLNYTSADDIIFQESLPENSNPTDLEFVNETTAWVTLENANYIRMFNPQDGSKIKDVDISKYAFNDDNFANASEMVQSGDSLFVLLQRRNGWSNGLKGKVLILRTSTGKVLGDITLPFKNPSDLAFVDGQLIVTISGEFFVSADSTRGVVSVNTQSHEVTLLATDLDLGGSPTSIKSTSDGVFITIQKGYEEDYTPIDEFARFDVSTGSFSSLEGYPLNGGLDYSEEYGTWIIGQRTFGAEGFLLVEGSKTTQVKISDMKGPTSILIDN